MKKSLLLLAAAFVAFAACNKEPEGPVYPDVEPGANYTFEGTVATDGFTWESSSIIGIYSLTEGVKIMNEECKIEEWANPAEKDSSWYKPSKWEGKATAPFKTPALDLVKGENEFLVYYPYDENMSYIPSQGMIYDLSISDNQIQPKAGVAGGCFAIGKAKGIAAQDIFKFSLDPISAILKINVSSSEFADYGLKKITLIDESGAAKLGGKFDVNVNTLAFTENNTFSKVATTITSVSNLGSGTQSIFVNLLPGDYSATEFTAIIELTSDKGNVTLPIKTKGVKCEAGKITELNLAGIKSADNIYPWYCPVETRKLVGCDYAYGDANCYFIQSKSAVYDGATLAPNPDIPESVTIDYRLRGDLTQAEIPEGVTFEWATTAKGAVYTLRTDSKVVADKYEFTVDAANYTVTVKNTGSTAGAPILLMKKGGKIIWGWALWNVAADGTKIEPVTSGTHQIANLAIGQATTNFNAFKAAAGHSTRTVNYYQWGRYLPASFWTSYWSLSVIGSAQGVETREMLGGNGCMVFGPFKTFKESLDYPYGAISHLDATNSLNNWTDEYIGDLWGCVMGKEDQAGTKSIYDPCPKGWRVPDRAVINEWADMFANPSTSDYISADGQLGLKKGDVYLEYDGYAGFNKLYKGVGADTEVRISNYATTGTAWSNGQSVLWSNYAASHTANSPFCFIFFGANKVGVEATVTKCGQMPRTAACPVRCQKDTDNR